MEGRGGLDALGPGGTVFLGPMLIFTLGMVASGGVRLLVQAGRQLAGQRGDAPFMTSRLKLGLSAAAVAVLLYQAGTWARFMWELDRERAGLARAAPLPADLLATLGAEVDLAGRSDVIVNAVNPSPFTGTRLTVTLTPCGEGVCTTTVDVLDWHWRPGALLTVSVQFAAATTGPSRWRITAAEGYR